MRGVPSVEEIVPPEWGVGRPVARAEDLGNAQVRIHAVGGRDRCKITQGSLQAGTLCGLEEELQGNRVVHVYPVADVGSNEELDVDVFFGGIASLAMPWHIVEVTLGMWTGVGWSCARSRVRARPADHFVRTTMHGLKYAVQLGVNNHVGIAVVHSRVVLGRSGIQVASTQGTGNLDALGLLYYQHLGPGATGPVFTGACL